MKKNLCLLSFLLVCLCIHAMEYDVDFTINTDEYEMTFVKYYSSTKVELMGYSEYDDGDVYYEPAIELVASNIPYNLIIPQTICPDGVTTYTVSYISDGAFGNGARKSTESRNVHYNSMSYANSIYSLSLPSTILSIKSMLPNIKILKCCATTPPELEIDIPSSCNVIYVPKSALSAYKTAERWSNYASLMVGYATGSSRISDISFSSKKYEVHCGSDIQLSPTITSGSTSNLTWTSSDNSVATVSESGLVTGVSKGTCYITATSSDGGYVFSTVLVKVNALPITNIALNEMEKTLYVGGILNSFTLLPTITPAESTSVGVVWSSSNPSVATVDENGVVLAVSAGNTTISCLAKDESGTTASCQITVKDISATQVGTGTKKSVVPFGPDYKHKEIFIRYKSSEICNAGSIQAISFTENYPYSTNKTVYAEIWMGKVEDNNFYNVNNPITVSAGTVLKEMVRVYEGQIVISQTNSSIRTVLLDTPYEYDGFSDLDIFISISLYPASAYTTSNIEYDCTETSGYTVKTRGFDDSVSTSTWTWTLQKYRPNIKFWIDEVIHPENILLQNNVVEMTVGETFSNAISFSPENVTIQKVVWSSNSEDIASVNSEGVITALKKGTAIITARTYNNLSASCTVTVKLDINSSDFSISSIPTATYTGLAQTPDVVVQHGSITLIKDTDYTLSYDDNIDVGTATVTITGKGYYTGTKMVNFTINPKNASGLLISSISSVTYDGSEQTPSVTVKDGSTTLTSGTDYTISYSNNINAGTATVNVTGKGNYSGTKSVDFTINPKSSSGLTISSIAAVTYNGSEHTPSVTVKDGTTTLTSGTDYTISYNNNINAGTATVDVTGKGNYSGTKSVDFTINPKSSSGLTISSIAAVTYNGSEQTPSVTVKDGTTTLTSGTDYTVSYSNNINVGTATATVTGKGNYSGTKSVNFTISSNNVSNLTINSIDAVTYNGFEQTPSVTVMDGETTLTNGTHYTVSYSNNTNAGTATATISGIGNYSGSKSANFTINRKNASNLTINSISALTYNGSVRTPTVTVNDDLFSHSLYTTDGIIKVFSNDYNIAINIRYLRYKENTCRNMMCCLVIFSPDNKEYILDSRDLFSHAELGAYCHSENGYTFIDLQAKKAGTWCLGLVQLYAGEWSYSTSTMYKATALVSGTDYSVSYSNNVNAGTATVTVTGKGNYTGTKSANFTINKAALTVTANSYNIKQGDPLPTFDVTYSGFKNSETASVLTTQPTISCDATSASPVGTYDINVSGAEAENYTLTYVKGLFTIETPSSVTISMNSLGKGTYCSEYPLDFTGVNGIKAYIVSGFNPLEGNLIITRVYEVPALTGLFIIGTPSAEFNIPVTITDFYYSNMMKGVIEASTIPFSENGYNNYVLAGDGHGGVIFKPSSGSLSANRAYVHIPSSIAGTRSFFGIETDDGSTTGIEGIQSFETNEADGDYYNLNGQKVQNVKKGLYIKNGKKVIIR